MDVATLKRQLDLVNERITASLADGITKYDKSGSGTSVSVERISLAELVKLRDDLVARIAQVSRSSRRSKRLVTRG